MNTGMTIPTGIRMTDARALLRLMAWLSPAFPTGSFAWSAGLEQAVDAGHVTNEDSLGTWLSGLVRHGGARNDALLFALAWREAPDSAAIARLGELAAALAPSAERHDEAMAQGKAFASAVANWFGGSQTEPIAELPLAIIAGAACRKGGVPLEDATAGFLQAFVSNQLQAAIRLGVTGQTGAARLLAGLESEIFTTAQTACNGSVDDLGGCAVLADIAGMQHETLSTRLFLS